jgi:hypothetical protein
MKRSQKLSISLAIVSVVCVLITYLYVLPIVKTVNADMNAYATRIAYRDNYKLHTNPLSNTVVEDICSKLGIKESSENCKPNIVVYAPELFDEVKTYFRNVPDQDKTYSNIENIFGQYLVYCESPVQDGRYKGHYRCEYDLQGDQVFPIFFRFDENDFYYEVIAKPIPWDS